MKTILIVLISLMGFGQASARDAADVILVLDHSGSMQINDPNRDSVKAIELFLSLPDSTDRVAMITFASEGESLFPFDRMDRPNLRHEAMRRVRAVRMNGRWTNFDAALRLAYERHSANPDTPHRKRVVVLFSDGQIDLGDTEANQKSQEMVLRELLPKFRDAAIPIYTVAFSQGADRALLREIAENTGGTPTSALDRKSVYESFVHIFEAFAQPLSTPIVDNRFTIDPSVEQLKLLIGHESGQESVQLLNPAGNLLDPSSTRPGLDWVRTPYVDRILLDKPEPGAWQIKGASGEKKAYLVSDVDLEIRFPIMARAMESVAGEAWLTYRGEPVTDPAILNDLKLHLDITDGTATRQVPLEPAAGGRFRGSVEFPRPGSDRVVVAAEHPTFQRQKEIAISILAAPATPVPAADSGPFREAATASVPPPEPRPAPAALPEPQGPPTTILSALAILAIINIALLGGGALVWWLWRRKTRPVMDVDEQDIDVHARRRVTNTGTAGRRR